MTSRVAATAELDAIARLAAGLVDAPSATVSAFDGATIVRVGSSGVSWPPDDEEPLLRTLARGERNVVVCRDVDGELPGSACAVPLFDDHEAVGALVAYAPRKLEPAHAAKRKLVDLAHVARELLIARRRAQTARAGERAAGYVAALAKMMRAPDWRTGIRIAIETLGVAGARHWDVRGSTLIDAGSWDRNRGLGATEAPLAAPALVRELVEAGVVAVADTRIERRAFELTDRAVAQLIAPIVQRNQLVAVLVFHHGEPRRWSDADLELAAAIGAWLGPLFALAGDTASLAERHVFEAAQQSADRVLISDRDGRLVYANAAAARVFGVPASDIAGRSIADISPPDLQTLPGFDRLRRIDHDPLIVGTPYLRRIVPVGGAPTTLEVTCTPYTLDGAPYFGFTARDLGPALARMQATLEAVPCAVAHVSLDGQFLRFNPQLATLVGRAPEILRPYRQTWDLPPPPDAPGLSFVDAFGLAGRVDLARLAQPFELAYELVRPDGTRVWIELAIVRGDGFFVVTARDTSDRRRASLALRAWVATVSNFSADIYETLCAYLGTTLAARSVLIGRLRGDTIEPIAGWRDGAAADMPAYALAGTPCEHGLRGGPCYFATGIQARFPNDRDLVELGAHSYLGAPVRNADGVAIGVVAVLGDRPLDPAVPFEAIIQLAAARASIAIQRSDAMAELASREEHLRQITESAAEVFWLSKWPSRELIFVTGGFERLTGRSLASLYANRDSWGAGLHPEDRARMEPAMLALDREPVDVEARVIRPDGTLRWIRIRAALVRDASGRPYRVAGSFDDITDIKVAQDSLRERERELAEALASSEREVEELHLQLGEDQLHGIIGTSANIRAVCRRLRQAAQSDVTVLIGGESGTGKELAANALHALSVRRDKPFVAINCAAIPEPLLESELFGHVKGAFTGATRDKVGLMQAADGGTLFLDEIGDMSPALQVKLLRALQDRQVRRVGDDKPLAVDVRLVSASHRDLKALVASGRMREDFYYRIKVFEVAMPALRDRREDIPALASHFTTEVGRAAGKSNLTISAEALRALLAHRWPGNVRELRNAIEHALVTIAGGTIQLHDLPVEIRDAETTAPTPEPTPAPTATTPEALRERIEDALRRSGGNRAEAARLLGIGRVTLWKRMRRLGMTADDKDAGDDG